MLRLILSLGSLALFGVAFDKTLDLLDQATAVVDQRLTVQ